MKAGIKIALVLLIGGIVLGGGIFGYKLYQKYLAISGAVELLEMAHSKTKSLKSKKKQSKKIAETKSSKSPSNWLEVQQKVKDTVVQVFANISEFNWLEPYKTPEQSKSAGSGFFINEEGDIVTNYHVVAQAACVQIQIPSFGMERFDASIVGVSPDRDIALLKLTDAARAKISQRINPIPYLELDDSDNILRSQEVLALGYPLGQARVKSTLGIVSGRERLGYFGYIQITAALNPGNSGGPALNSVGKVIGINNCGVMEAQNVGYIIPINEVKSALQDLYKVPLLRKPTLGCIFTVATPEMVSFLGNPGSGGWYIAKVFEDTLLEAVGIKEDDMLYAVNDNRVDIYGEMNVDWSEDKVSLFEYLNRLTIGDTINFLIYRKGERKEFTFKLEHKYLPSVRSIYPEFEPEAVDYEVIGGMVVMQLTLNHIGRMIQRCPDLVRFGRVEAQHEPSLVITYIQQNSQADKARVLRPGEIIEAINGEKVKTLDEFRKAALKSADNNYLTIRTEDKLYGVLALDKIIKDEDSLCSQYFFRKSNLVRRLADLSSTGTATLSA
ncbi:trypsin-like peptidase domain-containing protein [Candidatus Dependentiae bacterium]|jgi:serine protease Do|nr:trypsin-like peptidase domain-containing protein [Candidatus Dependentiae bacterium]